MVRDIVCGVLVIVIIIWKINPNGKIVGKKYNSFFIYDLFSLFDLELKLL